MLCDGAVTAGSETGGQVTRALDQTPFAEEVAQSRRLFIQKGWPTIDVTRRSIEETAAAIIDLYKEHRLRFIAQA